MKHQVQGAFKVVRRQDFLPRSQRWLAGRDHPLLIGHGQTNSQPSTVAFMLEQLDVEPSQNVLDVGSGSGWTSALLGHLVGSSGRVTGTEIIPDLVQWSRENLGKYDMPWVGIEQARHGVLGWPDNAPYDRIMVSAAAENVPPELVDQLASRGRMVIPAGNSIFTITKDSDGKVSEKEHTGFVFVPLIK